MSVVVHLQALLDDFDYSDDEEEAVDRKLPGQGEGLQLQPPEQQQQLLQQQDSNPPARYEDRERENTLQSTLCYCQYIHVINVSSCRFTARLLRSSVYMYVQRWLSGVPKVHFFIDVSVLFTFSFFPAVIPLHRRL